MDIFGILALKGSRIVIRRLAEKESLRYSELQQAIGSPSTTNLALLRLVGGGLVKKEVLNEPYRPVLYSLTPEGKRVAKLMVKLADQSRKASERIPK